MSCRVATFACNFEIWTPNVVKMSRKNRALWRAAAKIVFAIPPTSAASECVFSLLEAMFGKDQTDCLSDLIQGALMLRYNQRAVG